MTPLQIIAFRVGAGGPESLSPEQVGFYQSLASGAFKQDVALRPDGPKTTVPLSSEELNDKPAKIYADLLNQIENVEANPQVVLIDFFDPKADVRGTVYYHVARAVDSMFLGDAVGNWRQPKGVILMLADLPSEGDSLLTILRPHIDLGRVIIYSEGGDHLAAVTHTQPKSKDAFRLGLAELRGDPAELLRRKLLRQRGHYVRKSGETIIECVSFYYDGNLCGPELRMLFGQWMLNQLKDSVENTVLIYHEGYVRWVSGPLSRVANEYGISSCYSYSEIDSDALISERIRQATTIAIVSPLTDSGQTVQAIAEKIKSITSSAKLYFLSVLSTSGENEQNHIRKIPFGTSTIELRYFLKVPQNRYAHGGEEPCPMCAHGMKPTQEGSSDTIMLGTYDFWTMAFEHPLKEEDNVPLNRKSLGMIPNFAEMVNLNGAWLAHKIGNALAFASIGDPAKLTIVCPDQTTSRGLSDYLRVAMGASVVCIPDEVMQEFRARNSGDDLRARWEADSSSWYQRLIGTLYKDVVLLDEFTVTDGTRNSLLDLMKYLHMTVVAAFSLVDFAPQRDSERQNLPSLSLYSWHMPVEKLHQEVTNGPDK